MLSANFVIFIAVAYIFLLFIIAYFSDKHSQKGKKSFLNSPLVYTLSISVYATSWTFYGAVGSAARNGLEFLAIYLGPTLVFVGWWFILRKLVRVGRKHRITSIADLLSSRFGKSNRLGVLITLIAVIGTTPYIALQLKAITTSIQVISASSSLSAISGFDDGTLALGIAALMALFTIFFGTRNVDANEQHHGVVAAIAFEAIVKLLAFIAVGIFVVFSVGGGFANIFANASEAGIDIYRADSFGPRWIAILFLSAAAILCLPRQFQITVVENSNEGHLRTAAWAFPAYLFFMSLFTIPIALYGLTALPAGSNPDMFVLTLPLAENNTLLALFAFIGGFSSATSMIIIATIALSIMISNHIVMPIALRSSDNLGTEDGSGVTKLLLTSRRVSIALVLFLGFLYFWFAGNSDALAAMGLIAFVGVAQFLPSMIAALYWREASVKGAISATFVGFLVWAWTSFLPSFETSSEAVASLVERGPWGIGFLKPQALFGMGAMDPLVHSVFWSLLLNVVVLIVVSLFTKQSSLERIQANSFVDVFSKAHKNHAKLVRGSATVNDLMFVAQRVLGGKRAYSLFNNFAKQSGVKRDELRPTPELISLLERELAGSIGAASAHVVLSKVLSGGEVSLEEVMKIADETQQVIEYSQRLELTTKKLRLTAKKLKQANESLTQLDKQKDDFLSKVSHEVRTPMTSIRSFSEILLTHRDISEKQRIKFVSTINQESKRLTNLLDEILDLNALEKGERVWINQEVDGEAILERVLNICSPIAMQKNVTLQQAKKTKKAIISAEPDRLAQVYINLITNAIKYNDAKKPVVTISSRIEKKDYIVEIKDNGSGVEPEDSELIFEKFSRGKRGKGFDDGGLGLGLAISREIIDKLNGRLELVATNNKGACFRVTIPLISSNKGGNNEI